MKLQPNPKLFLILALASVILGGGICFMALGGLNDANQKLSKLQADSKDAKALHKQLSDSQATLQECATQLQHLEAGVPDFAYVPTLLTDLEQVGKASGIAVIGVRPVPKTNVPKKEDTGDGSSQVKKRKAYEELDIEVKGRGTYRSVLNFIQALSKFPKVVAARTIDLSPKNDPGQTTSSLDVTINLRAYVFAEHQDPKKVTTAMAPSSTVSGSTHEG